MRVKTWISFDEQDGIERTRVDHRSYMTTKKSEGKPGITTTARKVELTRRSHGLAHLLAIGINDYDPGSGFSLLRVCVNDALTVRDLFHDIEQLNADKQKCAALTSKGNIPSKGVILKLVNELAADASEENRLIFYYSGHGHRIKDDFYLVPQDAHASDDPDVLISFSKILNILNASPAKQKVVIVDACLSGTDTRHLKAATLSAKFLAGYLATTTGTAILSSCGIDEDSTTQSPNPRLSLFTHYLCEALSGASEALDEGYLTIHSMYSYVSRQVRQRAKSYHRNQNPALSNKVQGMMLIGDFTGSLIPSSLSFDGYPVRSLDFVETSPGHVKDVLTNIKRWGYSQEYLADRVNENLGEYFSEEISRRVARLAQDLQIPFGEIAVESSSIEFPDGEYSIAYESRDLKSGVYRVAASFRKPWLEHPERMLIALRAFEMQPEQMVIELNHKQNLASVSAAVRARGWKFKSVRLPEEFTAEHGLYRLRCEPSTLTFSGFMPKEILGDEADSLKQSLVAGVLDIMIER